MRSASGENSGFGAAPALSDLADAYVRNRVTSGGLTTSSARNHRSYLSRFVSIVGDQAPGDLPKASLERWAQWVCSDRNITPTTRRHQISAVRTFFRALVDQGVIASSPIDNLKLHPDLARPLLADLNLAPGTSGPGTVARLVEPYITERFRRGELSQLTIRKQDMGGRGVDVGLPPPFHRAGGRGG